MAKKQLKDDMREASADGQDRKLLLVDEDASDLDYYTEVLRYLGYEVRPVDSYSSAAATLGREPFDLVIIDQGSSDFEGRTVLSRAVETNRHVPVLVLTRVADADCCIEALDAGAYEYVQKPLTAAEVRDLVGDYLKPKPLAEKMPAGYDYTYQQDIAGSGGGAERESLRKAS